MKCICCNREFEVQQRHGGQNRLICYDCMPNDLSKKEKDKRRRQCLKIASDTLKEGIGCAKCGYNAYGAALDWHHIESHQKEENPAKQLQVGMLILKKLKNAFFYVQIAIENFIIKREKKAYL